MKKTLSHYHGRFARKLSQTQQSAEQESPGERQLRISESVKRLIFNSDNYFGIFFHDYSISFDELYKVMRIISIKHGLKLHHSTRRALGTTISLLDKNETIVLSLRTHDEYGSIQFRSTLDGYSEHNMNISKIAYIEDVIRVEDHILREVLFDLMNRIARKPLYYRI